jgi:hypothetical protein
VIASVIGGDFAQFDDEPEGSELSKSADFLTSTGA